MMASPESEIRRISDLDLERRRELDTWTAAGALFRSGTTIRNACVLAQSTVFVFDVLSRTRTDAVHTQVPVSNSAAVQIHAQAVAGLDRQNLLPGLRR